MRKFNRPFSESEILLEIMDRHPDWAVIVALVGGGQEIHRGEAGLSEWGRSLAARFHHWDVFVSPELKVGVHTTGPCLFPSTRGNLGHHEDRTAPERQSTLLQGRSAFRIRRRDPGTRFPASVFPRDWLVDFPIMLTRNLDLMRNWLRSRRRGSRRRGACRKQRRTAIACSWP